MLFTQYFNFTNVFLLQVITPDPWKAGASNTTKPGGRKVGENKLLTASKNRFNPMTTEFKKCKICKVIFIFVIPIMRINICFLISAKSAPGGFPLLPALRLQEGYLRDVRCEGAQHQGLQTDLHLMPGTGDNEGPEHEIK